MIPEKESLIFFEELAKRQERIYNDACDYGVPVFKGKITEEGMALKAQMVEHVTKLKSCYKFIRSLDNMNPAVFTTFIPFEKEDGFFVGVRMTLKWFSPKRNWQYLAIEFKREHQKENPFIGG